MQVFAGTLARIIEQIWNVCNKLGATAINSIRDILLVPDWADVHKGNSVNFINSQELARNIAESKHKNEIHKKDREIRCGLRSQDNERFCKAYVNKSVYGKISYQV